MYNKNDNAPDPAQEYTPGIAPNPPPAADPAPGEQDIAKYLSHLAKARGNLLMMIILTVGNVLLYYLDASISFPFSATFPQFAVFLGQEISQYYGPLLLIVGVIIGLLCLGFYMLCWVFSAKKPGWFIPAMVAFILDTLFLLWFMLDSFEVSSLIDIAFHFWVLYYLILAVIARGKLKQIAEQPEMVHSAEQ